MLWMEGLVCFYLEIYDYVIQKKSTVGLSKLYSHE